MGPEWLTIGALLLVGLTAGVTLLVATLIWRSGYKRGWRLARNAPPTCPACGYNLSGLSACRCPECGTTFVLETLWRSPVFLRGDRKQETDERPAAKARGAEQG